MKSIYRKSLAATALIMAALLPTSCSQNDEPASPTGGVVQVELFAQIGSEKTGKANSRAMTRVADNQWELNDMVGMYMVAENGSLPDNLVLGYANKRYRIVEGPGIGGFKLTAATQEDAMYYPDGNTVNFIAYYPYRSTITDYKYPLDIKTQDGNADLDFLYSASGTGSSTSAGAITFDHKLSKLTVKLVPQQGTLTLDAMVGKVTNVPVTGSFNLATGLIDGTVVRGDIDVTTNRQEDSGETFDTGEELVYTYFDIILIPHAVSGEESRLNFSTATRNYYWILPDDQIFEKGKEYTLTLGIDGDRITFHSVTIQPWGTGAETLSIPMVKLTGGDFPMGSSDGSEITFGGNTFTPVKDDDALISERPMHEVTISDFYMSKCEITNAQYCLFLNAKGITTATADAGGDFGPQILFNASASIAYSSGKWSAASGKENFPMVNVTWFGAFAFADWAGYRLPTEAQWEYACRGGDYFYGNVPYRWVSFDNKNNALASYAWFNNNGGAVTKAVGLKQPNEFGLYDMHGNVWEWCSDFYDAAYYASSPGTNPENTTASSNRVRRGGGYGDTDLNCRSAARGSDLPTVASGNLGFRVVFPIDTNI